MLKVILLDICPGPSNNSDSSAEQPVLSVAVAFFTVWPLFKLLTFDFTNYFLDHKLCVS